jgi:two-component system, NtrC family, sensor kinase
MKTNLTYLKKWMQKKRANISHNAMLEQRANKLQAAIARLEEGLENQKHSEQMLKQRAAQLALLNQIGKRIAAVMDLESVLHHAAQLAQQNFCYHHVALFLLDRENKTLVMKAKSGLLADRFPAEHRLGLNQGMVGWVGMHGKVLLSNDVRTEPHYLNLYPSTVTTLSELSVPVKVGQEVVGVLDVQSPQSDAFDENDVTVIETLADQIAVAIENARLYEAIRDELAERRRAEQALRESEKRYRTLIQTSPDAILYTDYQANTILCNQQAAQLFGYESPDEMVGIPALQFLLKENHSEILSKIQQMQPGWNIRNQEFTLLKRNGETFIADVSASIVPDEKGAAVGILAVTRDITERKHLERYMLRTERLVAMGNITAVLAHEIKNPLQAIQSNMELVLDFSLDPDEQAEHLRLCYQDTERLVELTNRLLNFANPRKSGSKTSNAAALVQQTLRLLEKPLQQAGVQVTFNASSVLQQIQVASEELNEVLLNLILNAVEAMPDGGQINIEAHIEDNDTLCIEVSNTDSKIAPENMEYIFDPFFTTKPEGTGLGLYISHSLIRKIGGMLTAENLPEENGVKFCIFLPVNLKDAQP